MKTVVNVGFALLLSSSIGFCQQSSNDLPSAPSAVKMEQEAPKTPPPAPQPPAQAAPPAPQPQATPSTTGNPDAPKPAQTASVPSSANNATSGTNQPADPPSDNTDDEAITTIRKTVDEVNLVFTVTDKHGHFVKNLNQNDFRILDDNRPPASVVAFSRETNLPLRVGLLVDSSNSIRDRFRFEQDAAIEFLNQIIRPRYDKAFVLGFDTTAEVTQDSSDNAEKLAHGVRMLRPGGGTAMFDAVYYACRDKLMKEAETTPTRRAIILLSDGEDNQSRVTREEAIEMAQRASVVIYAISTNISGVKMRGDKVMERMADATGGRSFFPFKIEDVANAFSEIQDELRSQYLLAYKPANFVADGHFRSIDVTAENHKNLHVRVRKGYYAPRAGQ